MEECIEYNNKIMNDYSQFSYDIDNFTNLLKLSCSIVDIYEDKLKEFKDNNNDIGNIYKSGIKEIKDNALNDFNKKYNTNLYDQNYIGTMNMPEFIFDEIKFKEFCLINFNKIQELELTFEDNINIDNILKVSYHNLKGLRFFGKIKNIIIKITL